MQLESLWCRTLLLLKDKKKGGGGVVGEGDCDPAGILADGPPVKTTSFQPASVLGVKSAEDACLCKDLSAACVSTGLPCANQADIMNGQLCTLTRILGK